MHYLWARAYLILAVVQRPESVCMSLCVCVCVHYSKSKTKATREQLTLSINTVSMLYKTDSTWERTVNSRLRCLICVSMFDPCVRSRGHYSALAGSVNHKDTVKEVPSVLFVTSTCITLSKADLTLYCTLRQIWTHQWFSITGWRHKQVIYCIRGNEEGMTFR